VSTIRVDVLTRSVDVLSALARPDEQASIDEIRGRVTQRRLRVLVAGEAKRGKSTLVNCLLGRDLLPVGVIPVTAIVTTVHRAPGLEEFARVTFLDGRQARHELAELADFITEAGNPTNVRKVRAVDVLITAELLTRYDLELVDTPGTGSIYEHNSAAAHEALDTLDAAIFVVTANPPISAAERDLLRQVNDRSVSTFIVLNKADQLDTDELREATEFTEQVCAQATGTRAAIFPCAARRGLADPGYRLFASAFEDYIASRGRADAERALRGHLIHLTRSLLDAAVLTERGLQLAATSSADRVRLFRDRILELTSRGQELEDRCWAIERGMRRTLDMSATELVPTLVTACRERAQAAFANDLADLPSDQLEEHGRVLVVDLIRDRVDRWRTEQADVLEASLAGLRERVVADVEAQIAELRQAARDLLDVTLSVQADAQLLRPSQRFWYAFDRPAAVELPLAATVRRLAPGRARRAISRVFDEIPDLADRQAGRARSDLAQRLRDSTHALAAALKTELQDTVGRVHAATAEAVALSMSARSERDARRSELTARMTTLRSVLEDLTVSGSR
jgi:small GTP-binding protein